MLSKRRSFGTVSTNWLGNNQESGFHASKTTNSIQVGPTLLFSALAYVLWIAVSAARGVNILDVMQN